MYFPFRHPEGIDRSRCFVHSTHQLLLLLMLMLMLMLLYWTLFLCQVVGTHDASNPVKEGKGTPLLTCDVWVSAADDAI